MGVIILHLYTKEPQNTRGKKTILLNFIKTNTQSFRNDIFIFRVIL